MGTVLLGSVPMLPRNPRSSVETQSAGQSMVSATKGQAESTAARHSRADRRSRRAVGTALDRAFPNGAKCTIFLAIIWPEK